MSFSFKRARAIFIKDYKEFSRNYAVSIMLIFPITLALLLRSQDLSSAGSVGVIFALLLNLSFALVASFTQACLIAEEKERNTLRSLMMTPATAIEVLIGKSSLVFTISAVVLTLVTYIFGYAPTNIWAFLIVLIFSTIFYITIGTICGLFAKSLLDASLIAIPIIIIFPSAPYGVALAKDFPIFKVLEYVPSSQLVFLLDKSSTSMTTGELLKPLLIILAWAIIFTIVSIALYQRRLKDE